MRSGKVLVLLILSAVAIFGGLLYASPRKLSTADFWGKLDQSRNNPKFLNTWGWEDSPFISADGKELYFMYTPWNFFPIFTGGTPVKIGVDRPGHVSKSENPWSDANLYVSRKNAAGKFEQPVRIHFADNGGGCCAMVSPDGKQMYLGRDNAVGPRDKMDIYVAERLPDGSWTTPKNIGLPVNTEAGEDNPHISANGQSLYFASNRPGSIGGKDLYVSRRVDSAWSKPKKLSEKESINAGDEDQIWVSDDENRIYFGREGTGLMTSELKDGDWTDPVRFFPGTKEVVGELSMTSDEKQSYFAIVDFEMKDIILSRAMKQPNGTWAPAERLE